MIRTMSDTEDHRLGDLLDRLAAVADRADVNIADVLGAVGERSFAPIILVIALLMVSPLSGIPGAPTVSGLLICLVGVQALLGRRHLWLPDAILRRSIPKTRLRAAIGWLKRPAAWFDRHSHIRWPLLTTPPLRWATMATCVAVAMIWPALELLPFVTSLGAGAIALLSFGLLTRDGLYVVLGFAVIAGVLGMVLRVLGAG